MHFLQDQLKGPVLLNYGIEECRFLKPVYPGSTFPPGPRLGVKRLVDETGEIAALATILPSRKVDQS